MSSLFKSIAKIAPIATAFIPGIGIPAAAAIGAGSGLLSGGGLKGALLGGATGALGAGGASSLLGQGGALGTNLSGAALKGASGALTGAAGGLAAGGGLKSALLGAGLGGLGGYATGGGLNDLGIGEAAGTPLSGGLQGPTQGSGALGSVTRGISSITSPLSGIGAGNTSSIFSGNNLLTAGSLLNSGMAQSEMEDQLLASQNAARKELEPYLQNGRLSSQRLSELLGIGGDPNSEGYGTLGRRFEAPDFETDPGYQFRLQQGQQAIDRSLGARGKMFSGEALQAAQDYGQGLADQTYNDAWNRWRADQTDLYNRYSGLIDNGQNAANSAAGIAGTIGDIKANATLGQSNLINSGLSQIFGGARRAIGYRADGSPIYEDELMQQGGAA